MKLGSLASARANNYDRNASSIGLSYTGATGPHTNTTRLTSTIPAGYKEVIESCVLTSTRYAVGTVVGACYLYAGVTPSGGSYLDILRNIDYLNTLYRVVESQIGYGVTLYAGDAFKCASEDQFTGGGLFYTLAYKAIRFDA